MEIKGIDLFWSDDKGWLAPRIKSMSFDELVEVCLSATFVIGANYYGGLPSLRFKSRESLLTFLAEGREIETYEDGGNYASIIIREKKEC